MSIKLQAAVKAILTGTALLASSSAFADLNSILAGNSSDMPPSWTGGSVDGTTRSNWAAGSSTATYAVSESGSTFNAVVGVVGANSSITTGNGSYVSGNSGPITGNGTLATSLSSNDGWTGNSSLNNDAWGHVGGNFYDIAVTAPNQTVTITAATLTGNADLGMTVYATNGVFNGGTNGATSAGLGFGGSPLTAIGSNPGHDFNQVGQIGAAGTGWIAAPTNVNGVATVLSNTNPATGGPGNPTIAEGNVYETLAYANAGIASSGNTNGYGQTINQGVNQVSTDGLFFSGSVGGSVQSSNANSTSYSQSIASLTFNNLAVGTYLVFLGGANSTTTLGSTVQLAVTSVPLPGAVYLFGSALAGLAAAGRRKYQSA